MSALFRYEKTLSCHNYLRYRCASCLGHWTLACYAVHADYASVVRENADAGADRLSVYLDLRCEVR